MNRGPHLRLVETPEAVLLAETARPRPSVTMQAAASLILACDPSTVRKLLKAGALEGYKLGRTIRIYQDSIRSYQDRQKYGHVAEERKTRKKAISVAHREASAYLQRVGCL